MIDNGYAFALLIVILLLLLAVFAGRCKHGNFPKE